MYVNEEIGGSIIGKSEALPVAIDMSGARFNIQETAALLGVTESTLNQRCARGNVRFGGGEKPGRGVARLFSPAQVADLSLANVLMEIGLPISSAFAISEAVRKFWEKGSWSADSGSAHRFSRWLVIAPLARWSEEWLSRVQQVEDIGVTLSMYDLQNPEAKFGFNAARAAAGPMYMVVNIDTVLQQILVRMEQAVRSRYEGRRDDL